MTPEIKIRREIQDRVISAVRAIEECEGLIQPEILLGQSTYRMERGRALKLNECIEETLNCLKKLMVHI